MSTGQPFPWCKLRAVSHNILLVCYLLLAGRGHAQSTAYYYVQRTDTIFSLAKESQIRSEPYYFPSYDEYPVLQSGKKLTRGMRFKIQIPPVAALRDTGRNLEFVARYRTSNIKSVRFTLASGSVSQTMFGIEIGQDGYQLPLTRPVERATLLRGICYLFIDYDIDNADQPGELVVGDLWIGSRNYDRKIAHLQFLKDTLFATKPAEYEYEQTPFESYGVYEHFPKDQAEESFKGSYELEDTITATLDLLKNLVLSLIDDYPFYAERKLDKKYILKDATSIFNSFQGANFCGLIDVLNRFLSERFADPHFAIRSKCAAVSKQTPIYAYNLHGKYVVAAILDDALATRVPLGAEILSINDSLISGVVRNARQVNELLKQHVGDSVRLTVKASGSNIDMVSYVIKKKYNIGKSYKPADLDFQILNDSTAYYGIHKISSDLPSDFLNNIDSANSRKILILDLRGNGGGDYFAAAQFASLLINAPFKYFDTKNILSGKLDSVYVMPRAGKTFLSMDKEIKILIDSNTACVAELLTKTLMRNVDNVTIIGKESSRGALAFIQEIRLPRDNIVIATNCMNTIKIQFDGESIEGVGIRPDVLVDIESVKDLQPYEDKVLTVAISK